MNEMEKRNIIWKTETEKRQINLEWNFKHLQAAQFDLIKTHEPLTLTFTDLLIAVKSSLIKCGEFQNIVGVLTNCDQ